MSRSDPKLPATPPDVLDRRAALDALPDAIDWAYGGVSLRRRFLRPAARVSAADARLPIDISLLSARRRPA